MTTTSAADLGALLGQLGLHDSLPTTTSPAGSILTRPYDIYRAHLADVTSKILGCDVGEAYEAIAASNNQDNGDMSLVLPKLGLSGDRAKQFIDESLPKFKSALFFLPLADGVHLRFFFSLKTLPQLILTYIRDRGNMYGQDIASNPQDGLATSEKARKTVVIDFSSPNLAAEFTTAHLRSTIIGAQLANLYEGMGWKVIRLNYFGDWGKDIGLLAVGWNRFGSQVAFDQNPMGHLLDVHERINELFQDEKDTRTKIHKEGGDTAAIESEGIFAERDAFCKRMEDGEAEAIDLWKRIHSVNVDYYRAAYARLGIRFDSLTGESEVKPSTVEQLEEKLKEKGVYECSENSWIIDYSKHGPRTLGVAVLRQRTGTTSYLLRDIAAAIERHDEYAFDKMIYVVAAEQDTHFQKVFQGLRYADRDDIADKLEYVGFGKVSGMSPQLGKVHLLGDIIDQSINATRDVLGIDQENHGHIPNSEESATILGLSALIAQDSASRRATAYKFNTKKMVSLEGASGPHLQSVYAKLRAKVDEAHIDDSSFETIDYTHLQEDPWTEVLRLLVQYPEVTATAFKNHEPSLILGFLVRLVDEVMFNCMCEGDGADEAEGGNPEQEPPEAIVAQAWLYKSALQVLKNGMLMLGLPLIC